MDLLTSLCQELLCEITRYLTYQDLGTLGRCAWHYYPLVHDRSLLQCTLLNAHSGEEKELARSAIVLMMKDTPSSVELARLDLILSFYPHWSSTPVALNVRCNSEIYHEGFDVQEVFLPLEMVRNKRVLLLLLRWGADLTVKSSKYNVNAGSDLHLYQNDVTIKGFTKEDRLLSSEPLPYGYIGTDEDLTHFSWSLLSRFEAQDVQVYEDMMNSSHYHTYTNFIMTFLYDILPLYPRRALPFLVDLGSQSRFTIENYFILSYLLRYIDQPAKHVRNYGLSFIRRHSDELSFLIGRHSKGGDWWKAPILTLDDRSFRADYHFGRGYLAALSLLQPMTTYSLDLEGPTISSFVTINAIYGHPCKALVTDGLPSSRYTVEFVTNGQSCILQYDHPDFYRGAYLACTHYHAEVKKPTMVEHLSFIPPSE